MGDSTVHRGSGIDLVADIEMTGTPVLSRLYTATEDASWNIIVTVAAGMRINVHKILFSSDGNITGQVKFRLGTTEIGGQFNPKDGGEYIILSNFPDFVEGADGENLEINAPAGDYNVNYTYEVVL